MVNPLALDSRLGREVGQLLERGDELGPAIGIARIIERVDADEQVARAGRLGPGQREAEEDRVARRHVGDRDARARTPSFGTVDVAGQRRAAERAQVERQDDVPVGELGRDRSRRLELDPVALAVIDGQREHRRSPARARARRRPSNRARRTAGRRLLPDLLAHGASWRRHLGGQPRDKRRAARPRTGGPVPGQSPIGRKACQIRHKPLLRRSRLNPGLMTTGISSAIRRLVAPEARN